MQNLNPQQPDACVGVSVLVYKADFPGETWTSSKKGFNNTGNGRKDKK